MPTGWRFEGFHQRTGYDLRKEWKNEMNELQQRGWGQTSYDRFHLTAEGLRFADAAGELFLRS